MKLQVQYCCNENKFFPACPYKFYKIPILQKNPFATFSFSVFSLCFIFRVDVKKVIFSSFPLFFTFFWLNKEGTKKPLFRLLLRPFFFAPRSTLSNSGSQPFSSSSPGTMFFEVFCPGKYVFVLWSAVTIT